ncbi:hypothetical protein TNCT_379421 [Trichonephila clavata]|uniref:Uncharacterized protein n=1 Tax=Trichonephila clavata TaxID=2740835 RepID=A0A8X6JB19_TRICU|nr:hypothetical protein TNCT_379421 [Trichonephila clavata]
MCGTFQESILGAVGGVTIHIIGYLNLVLLCFCFTPLKVRVPSYYERPVSIAVYGHPSHEVSLYELKIDVYESGAEIEEIYEDLNAEETKTAHLINQLLFRIYL